MVRGDAVDFDRILDPKTSMSIIGFTLNTTTLDIALDTAVVYFGIENTFGRYTAGTPLASYFAAINATHRARPDDPNASLLVKGNVTYEEDGVYHRSFRNEVPRSPIPRRKYPELQTSK